MCACGLLLALVGLSATANLPTSGAAATARTRATTRTTSRAGGHSGTYWSRRIQEYRAATQHWLTVVRGRPPHDLSRSLAAESAQRLRGLAIVWQHREHVAWTTAHHPPLLRDWYCIHHYEGSWTDHGAPYWGGLQMDYSFQSTYGPWLLRHEGTADHWTSLEQIWTAVRAWRVRGFSPWSNTARDCGVY
ncbi:MAG TPA: hypothetical protein VKR79_09100 [Gaiellaceae bacterium]|nr:hypothetical protein [Gaiellaceae bacterium]